MDEQKINSIFNQDNLRATLQVMDFHEVARRTLDLADGDMPGCAWLDFAGEVHYAETMSEVDGMVLCMCVESTTGDSDDQFWIATWLGQIGLEEQSEQLASAFNTIHS